MGRAGLEPAATGLKIQSQDKEPQEEEDRNDEEKP